MRDVALVVPGRITTRTGGYGYDRRMADGLRRRGWAVDVHELDGSFPRPSATALDEAERVLAAIPAGTIVLVDGLALGGMPDVAAHAADRLRLGAIVHHPLADETGLESAVAAGLEASERRALGLVRRVVVTSAATACALARYGVERSRVAVIEPGTDPAPLARGSSGDPLHLLSVAAVIPRKGHEVLFRALATLREGSWRLTVVGSLDRDPGLVARLGAQLAAHAIADRVRLAGETDESGVAASFDAADVFVAPALHEGYGMAVAEALARGLPVIGTATGALPDLLAGGAGLVVPAGDAAALADALARVLGEPQLRANLASAARRVRAILPTWDQGVARMTALLDDLAREAL